MTAPAAVDPQLADPRPAGEWCLPPRHRSRWVFAGFPAFLGRIDTATRCGIWVEEPVDHDFDPQRLITVDLSRTPAQAAAGRIGPDQVQVDDCFAGPHGAVAGTTVGPRWPEMRLNGAVYLEAGLLAGLPDTVQPRFPPAGAQGRAYEYASVVYRPDTDDPRAGRRYAGHHGRILRESGSLAQVAVHPPGTSLREGVALVTVWLDLASDEQCDVGPDALTTIGVGGAPKTGPLFLICGTLPRPASDPQQRVGSDPPPCGRREGR